MSKKDQQSKYLSAFYPTSGSQNTQRNVARESQTNPQKETDKFKNPAEFFKSSQALSSQAHTSQQRSVKPQVKRINFSGSHETSAHFKPKQPVMGNPNKIANKSNFQGYEAPLSTPQRKPFVGLDESLAKSKALELQWTTKMRQAKKAGLEAQKLHGNVQEKRVDTRPSSDMGKSPMGKSSWADVTVSRSDTQCKNQQNDPWYSNDVWGDDLPAEALDECLLMAMTQEAKKPAPNPPDINPLTSWLDETWASPEKVSFPSQKLPKSVQSCAKTLHFPVKADEPKKDKKPDDFMSLLAEDDVSFMAILDNIESQQKTPVRSVSKGSSSSSGSSSLTAQSQPILKMHGASPLKPPGLTKSIIPFSERMPVSSTSGAKSSFIIKAKEFESPSKAEGLTMSQRILQKPTKSLPSPTTAKKGFTTEWLRGQLEKISSQYSTLKEDVQVKEGESKLLREKLKTAEEEVQKHKREKAQELETLRETFEKKVKQLEKQLEATQVQALFKAKEAESTLGRYRELKTVSVNSPESPSVGPAFKSFPLAGNRPGEHSRVLCDVTLASTDIVEASPVMTPKKLDFSPCVQETPEKSTVETEFEIKPVTTQARPAKRERIFAEGLISKNSPFIRLATNIVHGEQPKRELNHFLMPPTEYLPHNILQTEFSEQEFENYPIRRPTLVELWGTSYDAFGEAVLNDYEKAKVGDALPSDPARCILSKSRYFSDLKPIYGYLTTLSHKTVWGSPERAMAKEVVDLATTMVKELYSTLGDPRLLQTTYTIYDRDPTILKDFHNCTELIDVFDPISPSRWGDESFVELRRCLVIIGFLCSHDHMTARYIVNPKAYQTGRTSEFYPPEASQSLNKKSNSSHGNASFQISFNEGERKPSELKLMQMYRDLHSKKLTMVSELAASIIPRSDKIPQIKEHLELLDKLPSKPGIFSITEDRKDIKAAFDKAMEMSARENKLMSVEVMGANTNSNTEIKPNFEELKQCCKELDIKLDCSNVQKLLDTLKDGCTPGNLPILKKMLQARDATKREAASEKKPITIEKDWTRVPSYFEETLNSDILKLNVDDNSSVFSAPSNRCISSLEKRLMELTLKNVKHLKTRVKKTLEGATTKDLDVTIYVNSSPDVDLEVSRKRKNSMNDDQPQKVSRIAEYETPPFDMTLYSQIQKKDTDNDDVVILESQSKEPSDIKDDQLAKFEKREEIAELRRKMLAEEKEKETKRNPSSSNRRALAPVRLPGQSTQACDEMADTEMVMEIEKMFLSQARPEVLEESRWSPSSDSEDENDDRSRTIGMGNEDEVEIEFIPDLVKKFHNKLTNAALLELLCEVFKECGILRFTHRLKGVMLGTIIMLQYIMAYQKKEAEPYCSKISAIIREILYTRPSPRVVFEVNVFLRYAVSVTGFTKMLCHNASQETFVMRPGQVHFTRGACLLEVICIIMTYATDEETDCGIYFEMTHWVYYIICSEKKHMASLYEQDYNNKRRCMCITALNNTMVMIAHRTLSLYRGQVETLEKDSPKRDIMRKIFIRSLQIFRVMYTYGPLPFLHSIKNQYTEYRQILTWLRSMHDKELFYQDFRLSKCDLYIVEELLKDTKDPNSYPARKESEPPDFGDLFGQGKPWPYDLNNFHSLFKPESSESDSE